MLTPTEYCEALERDAHGFVDIVRSADATAPVPACPGWQLADLGRHLGSVHRWAVGAIRAGQPGERPTGPTDVPALVAWLTEGAAGLVDVLRAADPDAPAWTFGPPPHRVSFWARRQAHETAMHLVDAQQSAGLPVRMEPRLAADGVDEVVTMLFPRQVRLERIPPLARGLRLVLSDAPAATFVLAGDGTRPDAATAATLTGSAAGVLLALWGRGSPDDLHVDGDRDLALSVLDAGITP